MRTHTDQSYMFKFIVVYVCVNCFGRTVLYMCNLRLIIICIMRAQGIDECMINVLLLLLLKTAFDSSSIPVGELNEVGYFAYRLI